MVWAWDEETGDVALKPVKQLFINESDELIHLTVNGEEITTTPTHPFYVAHKGWYAAVDLRAGDILVLVNGEYVTLEKTQHEILEAPIKVYNFEVEDYHTYFVGDDGVLAHNACGDTGTYNELRAQNKGSGNEVHHIIEKRFIKGNPSLGSSGQMRSVVLTKAQHRAYTNAWRKALPYGRQYSLTQIARAAKTVYANNGKLLSLAMKQLGA